MNIENKSPLKKEARKMIKEPQPLLSYKTLIPMEINVQEILVEKVINYLPPKEQKWEWNNRPSAKYAAYKIQERYALLNEENIRFLVLNQDREDIKKWLEEHTGKCLFAFDNALKSHANPNTIIMVFHKGHWVEGNVLFLSDKLPTHEPGWEKAYALCKKKDRSSNI